MCYQKYGTGTPNLVWDSKELPKDMTFTVRTEGRVEISPVKECEVEKLTVLYKLFLVAEKPFMRLLLDTDL